MGSTQVAVPPRDGAQQAPPGAGLFNFVPVLFVAFVVYFLMIRPQQKQMKEHRRMIDSLKVGDRVLTQGGIYGTVASLKGTIVQLKVAEDVRIEMDRTAISKVLSESANGASAGAGTASHS